MVKKYIKLKGKTPALMEESEIEKILEKQFDKPKKKKVKKESVENGN